MIEDVKSPYAIFETDTDLETKGRWIDYGVAGEYLIARAGGSNRKYADLLSKRMKPYRRQIDTGTMNNEKAKTILIQTFVDAILLGWKNVNGRDGNPLEFTRENAIQLMTDLPSLMEDLQKQAMNFSVFRRHEVEKDLGK